MWALRLTLLLAIAYVCRGQNAYFDIGASIRLNTVTNRDTSSISRRICFDGTNTYYTSGSQIFRVDGTTTSTAVIDTGGPDIYSISCHCNILVYSYRDGGDTFVVYYDTSGGGISIELNLGAVNNVGVELSPQHGLVIVGFNRIWIYDQAPLTTASETFTYDNTLDNLPRCVATYETVGGDRFVFVSFATNNNVQVITIDSTAVSGDEVSVTDREARKSGFVAEVSCVDIDQGSGQIYFLVVEDGDPTNWCLDRYAIGDWLSEPFPTAGTTVQQGTNGQIGSNVNGLVVCGSDCPATCDMTGCSCPTTGDLCGFCIGDVSTCQCQDSGQSGCTYTDTTLVSMCLVPTPHFDSYCIVDLPLAKRRKGDPIRVVGVGATSATFGMSRLVQTGRWNVNTLPIGTPFSGSNGAVSWDGFEAAVQSSARGRRFGVYEVSVSPSDATVNPENIPCIATENSGFYNQYYTYTRSIGDSVTLVATMRDPLRLRFMGDVRWYFTGLGSTSPTPVANCAGQLMCTITNLGPTDGGVYEAYRINRRKRTWHPLFYLFVRECPDGLYGGADNCPGNACPACVHGECDDISGLCTCKPGWTGDLCNNACTAGQVGQGCGIACDAIFSGRTDCSGLSFCVPGKVGCHCYSGFEAPECVTACGPGTCGPSCDSTCDGGAAACNARTCA